jgi:hypothetical protein
MFFFGQHSCRQVRVASCSFFCSLLCLQKCHVGLGIIFDSLQVSFPHFISDHIKSFENVCVVFHFLFCSKLSAIHLHFRSIFTIFLFICNWQCNISLPLLNTIKFVKVLFFVKRFFISENVSPPPPACGSTFKTPDPSPSCNIGLWSVPNPVWKLSTSANPPGNL